MKMEDSLIEFHPNSPTDSPRSLLTLDAMCSPNKMDTSFSPSKMDTSLSTSKANRSFSPTKTYSCSSPCKTNCSSPYKSSCYSPSKMDLRLSLNVPEEMNVSVHMCQDICFQVQNLYFHIC